MELIEKGKLAKAASFKLASLSTKEKNTALGAIADALIEKRDFILSANAKDIENGRSNGMSVSLLDRLELNSSRIKSMADGIREVIALNDPIGEAISMIKRPNGLKIAKLRVPLGVIGIIYEARPNVTSDAAVLCIKAGNAVILRGGKEAIHSNTAIVKVMQEAAYGAGLPVGSINLIEDTSRDSATGLMKLNEYLDVIIPRGGAGLIRAVVENATVPAIETGTGNCHIYIDKDAPLLMARDIAVNAKTTRPSVCNAAEKLIVHKEVDFLPMILSALEEKGVEIRGCKRTCAVYSNAKPIAEDEWDLEYSDLIIGVKIVDSLEEAITHINAHNSKHSEAIVTSDYQSSQRFLDAVDAAAVYVNASTRFTDGNEFGLGAEIGISTQKMHARGPMGLNELTSTKFVIYGDGQIR